MRRAAVVAFPLALLLSLGMVYRASSAAVAPQVSSGTNVWRAGVVGLSDDAAGTALFSARDVLPGSPAQRCITVTYTGDIDAEIRLTVPLASGVLRDFLLLSVEDAPGAARPDCAGFAPARVLVSGRSPSSLVAGHATFPNGLGPWTATGSGPREHSYRISYRLADADAAQGGTGSMLFRWEARSR